MKISNHYFYTADKVLKALKQNKEKVLNGQEVYKFAFNNGREQGYTLNVYRSATTLDSYTVSFAENRSSDDIVVYRHNDYNMYVTNNSSVDWDSARYFPMTEEGMKDAVQYIVDVLNGK